MEKKMKKFKRDFWPHHFLKFGILAAIAYWLAESYNDAFIPGVKGFAESLVSPPIHELWMRIVVVVFLAGVSRFIQTEMGRRKNAEERLKIALDEKSVEIDKRLKVEEELKASLDKKTEEINRRKIAEEGLEQSFNKLKLFAFSIMHDLKSPAASLHAFTSLLQGRYGDKLDDKGKNYCRVITSLAEQILFLVEDINSYICTKESKLNIETISIRELCGIIKDEFSSQSSMLGKELFCPQCDLAIRADRLLVVRALRNLVSNSLKHGRDLTEIMIDCRDEGSEFVISVQDDGVGLVGVNVDKIFDPFERGARSREVKGTGLGLAIVREVAERHSGKAWAERGKESGAVFSLSISKNI
jgi:signal transduction histidine kinase